MRRPDMTHILRHARTDANQRDALNSDPRAAVGLNVVGRVESVACSGEEWATGAACVVTSELPRACETADLLFASSAAVRYVDARFNEIGYGWFEGRSWLEYGEWLRERGPEARPPGASESWNEAMERVLDGLIAAIDLPSPRVVIGHGFWVSTLRRVVDKNEWLHVTDIGAVGHLSPTTLNDDGLRCAVDRVRTLVGRSRPRIIRPGGVV